MSHRAVCIVAMIFFGSIAILFLLLPDSDIVRGSIANISRWPDWARAEHFGLVMLLLALGFFCWGLRTAR